MSKYKTGDKFVVEINEVMESDCGTLYRADFSTLVFDDYGLDNLPQLVDGVNQHSYSKGLADAWDAARKISEMSDEEFWSAFNTHEVDECSIYACYTPQEAIAEIKAYEDSKEIRRGDEVIIENRTKGIITHVFGSELNCAYIMFADGSHMRYETSELTKTGRNFADKLDALLSEIGGK